MKSFVAGHARFQTTVYPAQRALYRRLATEGQSPKALVVSCSDSRVVPEIFTQSDPGEMFVCRNAGNVVPPYAATAADAVTSAIEYAVVGLGVEHIVVCGHTDCGAMKALLHPDMLDEMPSVAQWLGHCRCTHSVFRRAHKGGMGAKAAVRTLAMENVAQQIIHLRTHPSVAARMADGTLALHGWLFDIETGAVYAMDGATGRFATIETQTELPVALPRTGRTVTPTPHLVVAAE